MNFHEYASTETSAFVERIAAAAEAAAQHAVQELRRTADAEIARLRADAETLSRQVESLTAEGVELRTQADAEAVRASEALQQLEALAAEAQTTCEANDTVLRDLRAQLESHRQQADEAHALVAGLQSGMSSLRAQRQQVTALLGESIDAFDALAVASTLDDLFTKLVEQVAVQFPRVVIFRRKGQRLEGELAAGLDGSVNLADLVIPMSADSIITTAATQGVYEYAFTGDLAASRILPGDVPAFAVAAPVVFQGEALAVLYAESDQRDKGDAHAAFAGVLAAHTNVLLSRLTQELKIARELREYAQMLLHEAEEMFIADTREGRSEPDRLRRLRDTIDFGRQLYAQRAALEGPGAAGLLEEEIESLVEADPATAFSGALGAALVDMPVARAAS